MTRDRAQLQEWYRKAMLGRIEELRGLRPRLEERDAAACDHARAIGQALRGSGATFGFPRISEVAALIETSHDVDVLRRVEGLIGEIGALTVADREGVRIGPEWLARAAGLPDAGDVTRSADLAGAWAAVGQRTRLDGPALAKHVADYFSLEVADPSSGGRAARRLVPAAFATQARIVPLGEDSVTITVATAEPTAIGTESDLLRLTGRRPVYAVAAPGAIDTALAEIFEGEAAPRAPTATRLPGDGERRVLLVDDEPDQRLLVRTLLEKRGYTVVEAGDGLEALAVMGSEAPVELVVADLNMPRMDGLELIWELRDAEGRDPVPVIVVTGEVEEILETHLMEEGADDYVRKPIDARLFLARVEATIRRSRA